MSEMVERVARAIWDAECAGLPPRLRREPDDLDMATGAWANFLAKGEAAIRAMREPTPAMLVGGQVGYAGESMGVDCNLDVPEYLAGMVWHSMIDAALSDTTGEA